MLSNMQVFNEYYMPNIIETLAQMINKFNAASNGAIRLTTQGFTGDFLQHSFFSALHSAQRRVDRYAAQGTPSATNLAQVKESGVKVAGGFGPIVFEPSQMTWLQQPTAVAIEVVSRNFAEAMMADQLNTAIAALVAAISNVGATVTDDVSATAGISYGVLNDANALFGDASGLIRANVLTGQVFHKLIGQNLTNTAKLFVANNVTVVDVLGRAIVVTDAPALYLAGSPNKQYALGLVDSAAIVYDGGDVITNVQTINGKDRIETSIQMDYTFGLALKGYTWDETNGGKSPTNAELATGSNWDKTATSIKNTAGVLAIGDAAKN